MTTKFKLGAVASIKLIVKTCIEEQVLDHGQIANILAQCEHETGQWIYTEEIASGAAYESRRDLGNTQAGDGRRYKGRGYVQITGRHNYDKFGKLFGVDLVGNPELALAPELAVKIAVVGMRDGRFTHGIPIRNYIEGAKQDFYNARKLVNGLDKAIKIVGLSKKWLKEVPSLITGADPDPSVLPTPTDTGNIASQAQGPNGVSGPPVPANFTSLGICSEIFPIEFSLKEALHYAGCFSRAVGNSMGSNSNLGYSANGMKINGASAFNIADFNPDVPICDGCLIFPMKDKTIIQTSPFCQRRISKSSGRVYYHSGTDYASTNGAGSTEGMEVIAVADGTVVTPLVSGGYNPGLVDIVHEKLGNLLSRSAHIIPSVPSGTVVKQGDVIGKVGPYGNNAAHLHFELRKDKGAGGSAFSVEECKTKFLDPALFVRRS